MAFDIIIAIAVAIAVAVAVDVVVVVVTLRTYSVERYRLPLTGLDVRLLAGRMNIKRK